MRSVLPVIAMLSLLASTPAHAQTSGPLPRLSTRGRQMVDGSLGCSWSNENEPGLFNRSPVWSFYVQPSWLLFLRDGLGLGLYVGYEVRRPSTGIDREVAQQSPQSLSGQPVRMPWVSPIEHDATAGVSAAFELFASGRLSLYVRPYVGMSLRRRDVTSLRPSRAEPLGVAVRQEVRLDVRSQAGVRLPLVVQVSPYVGLGFGPDLLWENLAGDFNAVRLGFTSWIARSF